RPIVRRVCDLRGHDRDQRRWPALGALRQRAGVGGGGRDRRGRRDGAQGYPGRRKRDRKSTRLNSSHVSISYAVFCLKKKTKRNAVRNACTSATCSLSCFHMFI